MVGGGKTDPPAPPVPTGNTYVDLKIRRPGGDAKDKKESVKSAPSRPGKFHIMVENTGNKDGSIRVKEDPIGNDWVTQYFDFDGREITGEVKGAGWYSPSLYPSAWTLLRLEFRHKAGGDDKKGKVVIRGYADNADYVEAELHSKKDNLNTCSAD